jgi:hypothetical protein
MKGKVERRTVDLSVYPDLVVTYLSMRVNTPTGPKTLLGFGPKLPSLLKHSPTACCYTKALYFGFRDVRPGGPLAGGFAGQAGDRPADPSATTDPDARRQRSGSKRWPRQGK